MQDRSKKQSGFANLANLTSDKFLAEIILLYDARIKRENKEIDTLTTLHQNGIILPLPDASKDQTNAQIEEVRLAKELELQKQKSRREWLINIIFSLIWLMGFISIRYCSNTSRKRLR